MHHGFDRSYSALKNSVFSTSSRSDSPSNFQSVPVATSDVGPSDVGTREFPNDCLANSGDSAVLESRSLRQLLPNARFFSGSDVQFSSIAESSKTATEGELVVYRIGEGCPSQLVADALARGAAGILTEQILPCPLPQCIVGDVELAMAELTADSMGHPDRQLLTVGVIGSAGKTSTALLVSTMLRASSIRTAYQTNLGESDGLVQSTSADSVPVNESLIQWLGQTRDAQCRAAVIELSDNEARHGHYDAIEFDVVIVTGSASCSGDFGPSGLQSILDRVARDGVVIAPAEDTKAMRVIRDSGVRVLTYGVRKSADVTAKIIDQSGGMTTLLVTHQETTAAMETSLCGAAMAANHAAAVLVGLLVNQPLHEIVENLSRLRTIPGRGQRLESFGAAPVVLDAGGSPDRAESAMRTFRSMKSAGRLWCILAVDASDSREALARYGTLMERFADHAVVTATSNSCKQFLSAAHNVLDGVERCAAFRLVANRERAIEWAVAEAKPADTILVITGEREQSAFDQRTDLDRITNSVNAARKANQADSESPSIELKIYDESNS